MKNPKDISWSEMQEHIDTAQAYVVAWAMHDDEVIKEIMENFIVPEIKSGNIEYVIYALAFVCVHNVTGACNILNEYVEEFNMSPVELMKQCNDIRKKEDH